MGSNINKGLSRKITVLSFVAMVCVVMIHSHALGTIEHPAGWCVFVQALLMRTATNWAVPFFFVVSGFFFASHNLQKSPSVGWYGQLLGKKTRTLLVPYVLWTLVGTVISITLVMLNNHIMHHGIFERTFMAADGFWGKIDSLFGITRNGPKGNLALWYVRSLWLLFVISPLLVVLSKIHKATLLVIGLVLALAVPEVIIKFLSLRLDSVGWFCVGMGVSQLALENRRIPNVLFAFAGIGWGALSVFGGMERAGWLSLAYVTTFMLPIVSLLGILFWWGLYDRLSYCSRGDLPGCFKMTFWVYCLHGVVTGWILSLTLYLLGKTEWVAMVVSFFSVCGSLAICLVVGLFVKRNLPKVYVVLSGGR